MEKSRELQQKLYLAAKKCRHRRFHALYDRIYRSDILWRAYKEVKANGGAAGLDERTFDEIEGEGVGSFLRAIQNELKEKTYRPKPVLRVFIPKPDGSQRPLGIPTIKDRVVQQACKIVIEPIFEANFQDNSYAFRPKRSAHGALLDVGKTLVWKWWAVDMDIKSYFDAIDHDILMHLLRRRISDRRILKLISLWLKSGVVTDGKYTRSSVGSPQGGVISPLLSNIYLHVFDLYWNTTYSHLGKLIRYADDCVILCYSKSDAQNALQLATRFLKRLKLTLHPVKTKLVNMNIAGFDFLGFYFRKSHSRNTGKMVPYLWPSTKSMKRIRQKIHDITGRSMYRLTADMMVSKLNPVIRGWRYYFQIGNSTKKFQELDRYTRRRMYKFIRSRGGNRKRPTCDVMDDWYWRFSGIERFFIKGMIGS